jgi:hypothetical protein
MLTMKNFFCFLLAFVAGTFFATGVVRSDETETDQAAAKLEKAKKFALEELFDLRYKFQAGETFRTKVTHLVTVETKIQGTSETAKTRSVSTKLWKILSVDQQGNVTFANSVEAVDMWQKMSGRAEVNYNSATDAKPPAEYEHVANNIGKSLSTITIDKHGKILTRDKTLFNSGIGDLTVPLPTTPVKLGQSWHVPEDILLRMQDKTMKTIKARQRFTLQKVETGIATIDVKTEILTPVTDPKIQSQLVQKMQHGTIKFDIDAGRIRSKQMDLDETVIGFSGTDSVMQYLARLTEEPTEAPEVPAVTAKKPTKTFKKNR